MVDNVYENCPVVTNERFLMRLISREDAEDLLLCYGQPNDSVRANSFNCAYGYNVWTMEDIENTIDAWLQEYQNRQFIRWSIVDKNVDQAVGTVELFHRQADDYFNNCGILRVDLQASYEREEVIGDILSLLLPQAFSWFACDMIATKVAPGANERILALKRSGFQTTDETVVGSSGEVYDGFWVLYKNNLTNG